MTTPKRYELEDALPAIPDWPSIKPRQPYRPQRYPLAHAQRGSLGVIYLNAMALGKRCIVASEPG